jgi:hypothetical protein
VILATTVPRLTIGSVTINALILAALVGIGIFDLLGRYMSSGDFESIAFDAAIISATYSATELVQSYISNNSSGSPWGIRFLLGALIFLGILAIGGVARKRQAALYERVFEGLRHQLMNREDQARYGFVLEKTFHDMTSQFFIVSLLPQKPGKQGRRQEIVELINSYLPNDVKILEKELLLDVRLRWTLLTSLAVLGLAALLIPATTIH